ncbi:MAG: ATP phosphoribosyltransferase [Spirochaetales bacterium]|nr:ATP phosphoribosyltransferase [Spirochaetales bacterium]
MLRIALPNKGALSDDAVLIAREAGYKCKRTGRELLITDTEHRIDFFFLRPRDIAVYISNGILDLGITGRDLAVDSNVHYTELLALNFGHSSFYYAVPQKSGLGLKSFEGKTIATSYPNIVRNDLKKRHIKAGVVKLDGAVEISVQLGVAQVIADVVESGRTLKEAGLRTLGEPILKSEAIVIARNKDILKNREVVRFLDRLKGIVLAREYVMVEYDIPDHLLEKACRLTPGIESPTVSPLNEQGWKAVKAMTRKNDMNRIIDDLSSLGARGILVTDIRTCRI